MTKPTPRSPESSFNKSLPGNRKLCQTNLELISASKTKSLTNQVLRNKTGQSNHTNQPKQCNHFHHLNTTTQAKKRAFSQVSADSVGGNVTPELCGDGVKQLFNDVSEFLYALEREPRAVPNGYDHGNSSGAVVQGTSFALFLLYLDKVPIPVQKYSRGLGKWRNAQSSGELDYDTNTSPESTTPETVYDVKSVAAEEFTTTKTALIFPVGNTTVANIDVHTQIKLLDLRLAALFGYFFQPRD